VRRPTGQQEREEVLGLRAETEERLFPISFSISNISNTFSNDF
jgi:hypothetical protein